MAERLTDKQVAEKYRNGYFGDIGITGARYIKLTKLEDIMDKYGIESVEELDKFLSEHIFRFTIENERLKTLAKSCSLCPLADSKDILEQQLKALPNQVVDEIKKYIIDYFGGKEEYEEAFRINLYFELPLRELITDLDKLLKKHEEGK